MLYVGIYELLSIERPGCATAVKRVTAVHTPRLPQVRKETLRHVGARVGSSMVQFLFNGSLRVCRRERCFQTHQVCHSFPISKRLTGMVSLKEMV